MKQSHERFHLLRNTLIWGWTLNPWELQTPIREGRDCPEPLRLVGRPAPGSGPTACSQVCGTYRVGPSLPALLSSPPHHPPHFGVETLPAPKFRGGRRVWGRARRCPHCLSAKTHPLTLASRPAHPSRQSASVPRSGTDRESGLGLLGKAGADGEIAAAINPSLPRSALRGAGTRAGGVNSWASAHASAGSNPALYDQVRCW